MLEIEKNTNFIGDYKVYLRSKMWERRKFRYYSWHLKKCVCCGAKENIHLHHINYNNLGNEEDKNLSPLCGSCHKTFHSRYGLGGKKKFKTFVKEMQGYFQSKEEIEYYI